MNTQAFDSPPSRGDNIDLVRAFYAEKILKDSQKKYAEQIHREVRKPRVGGPFGLFSATTLDATEFAVIDVPATVDSWLEHTDKAPPDADDVDFPYQELPQCTGIS
jgi:hypothetical protein